AENHRNGVNPQNIQVGTPYIGLEHMPRKSIALDKRGEVRDVGSNKFKFRQGNILFGKLRPYFHKVGVAVEDGICSTDILVISPKESNWFSFVLSHVSSEDFVCFTDTCSTGTKMPSTKWNDMSLYDLVVPDGIISEAFNQIVTPNIQRIRSNILENRTLSNLRESLLPKLLSGELRIPDAEKLVETVV
ncbi:MAG: restriction endonuclease subunit S, partial [bacterium]